MSHIYLRLLLRVKSDCSPSSLDANAVSVKSGKTGAQGLMGRTPLTVPQHRARHDGLMTEPGARKVTVSCPYVFSCPLVRLFLTLSFFYF